MCVCVCVCVCVCIYIYIYIYIYMLEQEMVDQIYREMDIPVHKGDAGGGIDESIDEDL